MGGFNKQSAWILTGILEEKIYNVFVKISENSINKAFLSYEYVFHWKNIKLT